MKDRIEAFLADLDQSLVDHAGDRRLEIYPIGRAALVWQYDYPATTKDFDVLATAGGSELLQIALETFGEDTPKAKEHGLYLESVNEALPPTPQGYKSRASRMNGPWKVLSVFLLEPHDMAVTKLRRFAPGDREDVRLLCDLELLDPRNLEAMVEKAFLFVTDKDGDPMRDRAFEHLRIVQQYLRGEVDEF